MWPFRKYSILESGILKGGTDWHCHILPGVDDGIHTMEDALAVLAFYEKTGIKEVWLTPHIMEDCPNRTAALQERFAHLQAAYTGPITLHLAAENMMDALFIRRFADGDLLTLPDNRLLVETSYFNPPMGFWDTMDNIRLQGCKPVLAHPERYVYMTQADYVRLKEAGVLFQLNLMSLAGLYGKPAARNAFRLLRQGMYDLAGSDLHSLPSWRHAIQVKCLKRKEMKALLNLQFE